MHTQVSMRTLIHTPGGLSGCVELSEFAGEGGGGKASTGASSGAGAGGSHGTGGG